MNGQQNGQPQQQHIQLTAPQMTALVLLERRISELNSDAIVFTQLGAPALSAALTKATEDLSKAHDLFFVETQRVVKLAAELPKLVSG